MCRSQGAQCVGLDRGDLVFDQLRVLTPVQFSQEWQ